MCRMLAAKVVGTILLASAFSMAAENDSTPAGKTLLHIDNIEKVHQDPKVKSASFKIDSSYRITFIETYHWNNREGKTPGTIGLRHEDGTVYGPWQATGRKGQANVPNAYWFVEPGASIKPGRYTVVDSDPATWSHNDNSNSYGFVTVKGVLLPKK